MTYSIVARDASTGDLGVAVQSHFFGVGSVVPWAETGVGAVATQSIIDVSYGPDGLAAMRAGTSPAEALAQLVARDHASERRQVSMINASGEVATHTGTACIGATGHLIEDNVSAQANLVESEEVWPAMVAAFNEAPGDLAHRMMAALLAAEACGGDIRGRQAAGMLIVRGESTGSLADDRILDLRVDDAADPLAELSRLIDTFQAMSGFLALLEHPGLLTGELTVAEDTVESALAELAAAQAVLGDANREPTVWRGLLLGRAGRDGEASAAFGSAAEVDRRVPELVRRLAGAGMWNRPLSDLDALLGYQR